MLNKRILTLLDQYTNTITFDPKQDKSNITIEYPIEGEWSDEPNRFDFIHNKSEFQCQILRIKSMGHLCGYVYIPNKYVKFLKIDRKNIWNTPDVDVHGGITQSEKVTSKRYEYYENLKNTYVIGFDASHYQDYYPLSKYRSPEDIYRNFEYILQQIISLADQLYNIIEPRINNI